MLLITSRLFNTTKRHSVRVNAVLQSDDPFNVGDAQPCLGQLAFFFNPNISPIENHRLSVSAYVKHFSERIFDEALLEEIVPFYPTEGSGKLTYHWRPVLPQLCSDVDSDFALVMPYTDNSTFFPPYAIKSVSLVRSGRLPRSLPWEPFTPAWLSYIRMYFIESKAGRSPIDICEFDNSSYDPSAADVAYGTPYYSRYIANERRKADQALNRLEHDGDSSPELDIFGQVRLPWAKGKRK